MSIETLRRAIKRLGAIPYTDTLPELQEQLAQLKNPEVECELTDAKEDVLVEAQPETEAIAAQESQDSAETIQEPGNEEE